MWGGQQLGSVMQRTGDPAKQKTREGDRGLARLGRIKVSEAYCQQEG